jgi:hypothetical protein
MLFSDRALEAKRPPGIDGRTALADVVPTPGRFPPPRRLQYSRDFVNDKLTRDRRFNFVSLCTSFVAAMRNDRFNCVW